MSIIQKKYEELAPRGDSLADVVVLAQAWKKSHAFIRRHNWYADVLELDSSTIDLERRLGRWSEEVVDSEFLPDALRLVPAPKKAKWEFAPRPGPLTLESLLNTDLDSLGSEPAFGDWHPSKGAGESEPANEGKQILQPLRPLAHIAIRDQTMATAVMMCLAEAIESAQGDPTESNVMKARELGVVSYGNRLHCRWVSNPDKRTLAKFSWGNSRTYRQYFQDYRTFLARPRHVCAEFAPALQRGRELFVVALDIKSFFDRVDCSALLGVLQRLEAEHRERFGLPERMAADNAFWERAKRIFDWRWRDEDHAYAPLIQGDGAASLELGLPQGLVAAGFLANAYLVEFDRALHASAMAKDEIADGVTLLDYCRYVDDIRVVVEAEGRGARLQETLRLQVMEYFNKQLEAHRFRLNTQVRLELSEGKCTLTPYRSISSQSNMSALMDMLNAELSGTFDMESLVQAAGGLDGLLSLSDTLDDSVAKRSSRLSLATIATPTSDVRDDTVKRFVATRLAQLMRDRLAMTDVSARIDAAGASSESVTYGMALAHEFESVARNLVRCWAENPSLVLLLRCGVDLYPHPKLLAPVVEALGVKLFGASKKLSLEGIREVRVAEYVAADLFRAGAVETGFREDEEYPEGVDITGYREDLAALARRVIQERSGSPWYLQQQAYLYLASVGDVSLAASAMKVVAEVAPYRSLQRALVFEPVHADELINILPFALVAQQLNPNPRRFGVWLAEGLRATEDNVKQADVVTTVAFNRPDLLLAAMASRSSKAQQWARYAPKSLVEASRKKSARKSAIAPKADRSLLRLMLDDDNPFRQENGVLMLARALLQIDGISERLSNGLSAQDIVLSCADWSSVHALPAEKDFLIVQLLPSVAVSDPLYSTPPWVEEEKAWLYGLGRILRAALTGEFDFTSRRALVTEELGQYTGLRSTWFKRRFGLLNSARGLLDEPGPVSPWMSGLLSTLLQWPGVEFKANDAKAAASARTPGELLALVDKRMEEQRAIFGGRSGTPMYVVPTYDEGPLVDRPLRVAVVQPMIPRQSDFDAKDPTHWTPAMLAEHRRHLAAVCRLVYGKIRTWASARPAAPDEDGDAPLVDIVLFPELAVHPEHVSFLRRLSDKLRANVFAGLTFMHSAKLGGPINQGLWLIRTTSKGHGRSIQYAWQGKLHPMKLELAMGVKPYRPHMTLVELPIGTKTPTRVAAAICYDATDLDLLADLRGKSDVFLVSALNQDVQTFDNMVAALRFHMYQPVLLANSGEFGGSTAQAPYPKHEHMIAHVHGNNQVAVSVFEVDPAPFKSTRPPKTHKELKAPPAGYKGRPA
ncbi:RNA-directed DNA polymerase [Burkholderia pseudomallei]|uniref:RNA-directed DNA polymerase n=1 Tax=Burkholderia pseudomallei TaxID=28450 RepID=UPI0027E1B474|nr:RNA-directed DNA polymerase [Burkholderia pseudomallei]